MGPQPFVAEALPAFLAGESSGPRASPNPMPAPTSPACATTATRDGDGFVVNGRKIWTSWARYATLVPGAGPHRHARTRATAASPRSSSTSRSPGVEVSAIEQANGTDELAEVAFDDVHVPADRIVGELDGGWAVAMHILSHERGTFAWFRHCFLYQQLLDGAAHADGHERHGPRRRARSTSPRSPRPATPASWPTPPARRSVRRRRTPSCCCAPPSSRCTTASSPATPTSPSASRPPRSRSPRQEYLFSRIVTVYGGSQQMQLDTIAKQILRLP